MRIEQVKLKNIRSYVNETISFPKGTTALIGDIGSGKSTILHAIEFALFGLRKGLGASLLRNAKDEGSVVLIFTHDGKTVEIERTLKRTKETISAGFGKISINGYKSEATVTELNAKIAHILNYPADQTQRHHLLFKFSIYTPQSEMQHVLFAPAQERQEILRRLFGLDKYHRIASNAKTVYENIALRRNIYQTRAEDLPDVLESKLRLEEIKTTLQHTRPTTNYQDEVASLEAELTATQKKVLRTPLT